MTTRDIHSLLRERYQLPAFSVAFEVPDGTSSNRGRVIDALAVGCWKSVGIRIIGHEIKVSRADWLKELDQPEKAEAWKKHCHLWYLVVEKNVANPTELPPSWGLMERAGSGLKIKKAAEVNPSPEPVRVELLAGIMRCIQQGSDVERALRSQYDKGWQDGMKRAEESAKSSRQYALREHENLKRNVDEFCAASGIDMRWGGANVGKQFQAFQRFVQAGRDVAGIARTAAMIAKAAEDLGQQHELATAEAEGRNQP